MPQFESIDALSADRSRLEEEVKDLKRLISQQDAQRIQWVKNANDHYEKIKLEAHIEAQATAIEVIGTILARFNNAGDREFIILSLGYCVHCWDKVPHGKSCNCMRDD